MVKDTPLVPLKKIVNDNNKIKGGTKCSDDRQLDLVEYINNLKKEKEWHTQI